jgi:hypothetical protein
MQRQIFTRYVTSLHHAFQDEFVQRRHACIVYHTYLIHME